MAARGEPVLVGDWLDAFEEWSRVDRHNSAKYVKEQRAYLDWWAVRLAAVDLRALVLRKHVVPELDGARCRGQRIAALKAFCGWLTRVRFELDHNPVAQLKVPQSRPAQWRRSKVVAPAQLAVVDGLPSWARDGLVVLLGTGWHVSELYRFARSGDVSKPPQTSLEQGAAAVLETVHKHGELFRTAVSEEVAAAARRVRARGLHGVTALRRLVARACARARVAHWGPGQLRHTVATWAVANGADFGAVAAFLNHKDGRTTRRFYATHAVPRRVPTPR
ncbi:MAG: site-specific integrase [Deltaproteobacteria bacterium]|nr:site-specific integrase [Deltaproteobacteria bacterium]